MSTTDQTDDVEMEGLSDEDFLNQSPETFAAAPAAPVAPAPEAGTEVPAASAAVSDDDGTDGADLDDDEILSGAQAVAKPVVDGAQPDAAAAVAEADSHTTPNPTEAGDPPAAAGTGEAPDYEALYKLMMAPFKANGKDFAPSSPEDAVRLMQMGANYTKKMQALKPNLRLMRMLENNGLLEESKLSFLIDLDKKDPKAIQKLLHDGKIDPLEVDTSAAPAYTPGNHRVSDQEMQFHEVLSDVASTEAGKGTIVLINSRWDQASKQAIYQEPVLLSLINEQRANGIYDRICAEIDRQQTLGHLSDVPFIQAYKQVGDRLHSEGKLAIQAASQPAIPVPPVPSRQVLETRPAAPKKPVSNGDKARAASSGPRAVSKSSPKEFDPFAMSDAEIMAIPSPRF